jgi:uncharacterized protein with PQ loop repeat
MNFLEKLIRGISPKMLVLIMLAIGSWVIFGACLQLVSIYPELLSGEEVINFW